MKALLMAALVITLALAGCQDKIETTTRSGTTTGPLKEGKGAIAGLVIDDVFRPVPDALVLVAKQGSTATTDASGGFQIVDLDPGAYVLLVQSEGHAAAPRSVEVKAGEYTEVEITADRLANAGARTVTTEYSVFIPCAVSGVAASLTIDCTGDESGDSFRGGFNSNYTGYQNVTYLVTEMLTNVDASPEQGAFKVVVRDAETSSDPYWASKFIVEGRYMKLTMKLNNVSADDTEKRNAKWVNDRAVETYLFPQGSFKGESQQAIDAQCNAGGRCFESRGLGPQAGVRAKFVQTLFLGEPDGNIEDYGVLRPN